MKNRLTIESLGLVVWIVPMILAPSAGFAAGPADSPYPRPLNLGWLDSADRAADMGELDWLAGAIQRSSEGAAAANAAAFRARFGMSRLLLGSVDWLGKNPDETAVGASGPALSTLTASNFAHFAGSKARRNISTGATEIAVYSVAPFQSGDDVTILPAHPISGRPLFETSDFEIVRVEDVLTTGTDGHPSLIVERAARGTSEIAFPKDSFLYPRARDAAGRLWLWNMSLNAPVNGQAKRAHQTVPTWLAGWISGAQPRRPEWDGLVFESARGQLDPDALGNEGAALRAPDTDGDASQNADHGLDSSGSNRWGLGWMEATASLRALVGTEKFFVIGPSGAGASGLSAWPAPAGANGVWLDDFPNGAPGGDFDSAFAWLTFFQDDESGVTDKPLSIVYTRAETTAYGGGASNAPARVGLAAATLVGGWHIYTTPEGVAPFTDGVYRFPEYVGGDLASAGWLGYTLPGEPMIRHLDGLAPIAGDVDPIGWPAPTASRGAAAEGPVVDTTTYHDSPGSDKKSVLYSVTGVGTSYPMLDDVRGATPQLADVPAGTYTARFWARASFEGDPLPPARTVSVGFRSSEGVVTRAAVVPVGTQWREYFAVATLPSDDAYSIEFRFGGPKGNLWIDDLEMLEGGADRFSRRYQAGIVLLNMSDAAYSFGLPAEYRRLSAKEDTGDDGVNDGATGLSSQEVPPGDARFLLIDDLGPTPTAAPSPSPTASLTPTPTVSPSPTPFPTAPPTISPTPYPTVPGPTPTPLPTLAVNIIKGVLSSASFGETEWQQMDVNTDGSVDTADLVDYLVP